MSDQSDADQAPEWLARQAARIPEKKAVEAGVAAAAAALAGAKPVEVGGAEDAATKASAMKETATKEMGGRPGATRGKGVRKLAEEIFAATRLRADRVGVVYVYAGAAWEPLTEAGLLALIHKFDKSASSTKRRDIAAYIRADKYESDMSWGRVEDYEIACADGIVDVRTGKVRKHAPENYLERVLPVAWNVPEDKRDCPRWTGALEMWFDDSIAGGEIAGLQAFFGYLLMSHARLKKALLLYGESDTGKGIVFALAQLLVGRAYTCQLGVEDMDDPGRRAVLVGKALNVITELSSDALIADGGFKTLVSTEEPVLIDAKYREPIMYTPTAKHMISTNSLPRLNDQTMGTFNRLLIIPFTRVIPLANQDRDLQAKLAAELPGILRWAVEGARLLVEAKGRWPDVPAASSVLQGYKDEINPMRQFMSERLYRSEHGLTPLEVLADKYNKWNRGGRTASIKYVGKLLRGAGFGEAVRAARHKERVITCLHGWRVARDHPSELWAVRDLPETDLAGSALVEASESMPMSPAQEARAVQAMETLTDEPPPTDPDDPWDGGAHS
jgi:P4 family phage/plasmid primase-like protien